jgi:hypothetical protein
VVTRADLSPGQQAVQAIHAATEFVALHPGEWAGCTVILLAVPDETALEQLVYDLPLWVELVIFREPDRGGELTAIAVESLAASLLTHLPLALREEVNHDGR